LGSFLRSAGVKSQNFLIKTLASKVKYHSLPVLH
jgi:hypothetical protein